MARALPCLSLLVLLGCVGRPPTRMPERPPPTLRERVGVDSETRTLAADTQLAGPGGSTFTGPAGWTVTSRADRVALADAAGEVAVTFVVRGEADGAGAISAAWQQVAPGFARAVRLTTKPPARDGWDAVVNVTYETNAAELRRVWATARRSGGRWYVTLFDGTQAGWGRRFPQATIADKSLTVPGMVRESFVGEAAHKLDEPRLAALRAFVVAAQTQLQIPGVAVAVVQGGEVVMAEGFGVRQLGKPAKVDADTLFRVASMSKPLTTLLMARLVDEGVFAWDTQVVKLLPNFRLGEPEISGRLTMQHTVCACTGMPRQDLETIFDGAGTTAERMVAGMASMTPTTKLGETYQYSNPMVALGGYAAAHAARPDKPLDAAFREVMAEKIFNKLGMKRTTYDTAVARRGEFASPHASTHALAPAVIELGDDAWVDVWAPTGGAWSSAREYAQYLLLELADGKSPGGEQAVSTANLRARRVPQVRRSDSSSYGLGLVVEERGVPIFTHNGGLGGYSSTMFFLPEHGVGVVVLTNLGDGAAWLVPLRRKVLELLFDGRPEADEDLAFAAQERREAAAKEAASVEIKPDVAWLQRFVGKYTSAGLGEVKIKVTGGVGVLDAGEWSSAIGRKTEADGTIKLVLTTPPWRYEFLPGEANGAVTLTLDVPQQRHVLTRAAGK